MGNRSTTYLRHSHQPLVYQGELIGAVTCRRPRCRDGLRAGSCLVIYTIVRSRHPKQYHLEYVYSCMGYKLPAAWNQNGEPEQGVLLVGDGSYLMLLPYRNFQQKASHDLSYLQQWLQDHRRFAPR